ncbi:MAG: luciferase [Marine Group III euryarchaeote CG-Epi2]|uniref:Luciferase n=1 Tax=Marine Group III euryarchaeote CG-Epi2 TaxID=1888996 RepID=A0A1J5U3I4_9ARCH|nr:MAG: luciferase [Marine Group III euryarchaeote CG-Epi2]
MEIGIHTFASANFKDKNGNQIPNDQAINELIDRIVFADKVGIDEVGIGEHHREEFLDSAAHITLAAAAARTKNIRLASSVTVLSAADPVRVFQNFATLDLVSNGRAEIIAGRGSFTEAYPLFGLRMEDYNGLYAEKLDLLLKIRDNEIVNWSGKFRPDLVEQAVYPRPIQDPLPIWVGVGGTPESFVRAGVLGLPLMIAIIGGETHRFAPLVELYRNAGKKAGHDPEKLKVGVHSLGYVAETREQAINDFFPGYAESFTRIGRERGWPPVTMSHFESQIGPTGALVVGNVEEVVEKVLRHSEALGGLSRFSFQLDVAGLTHEQLMNAIDLLGTKVSPLVNK